MDVIAPLCIIALIPPPPIHQAIYPSLYPYIISPRSPFHTIMTESKGDTKPCYSLLMLQSPFIILDPLLTPLMFKHHVGKIHLYLPVTFSLMLHALFDITMSFIHNFFNEQSGSKFVNVVFV